MPNIKSAIKRMHSDAKKTASNNVVLSELKTLNKRLFAIQKDSKELDALATRLTSRYDSAVSKGAIPQRRASRKKSRIAHFVAKLKTSKTSKAKSSKSA